MPSCVRPLTTDDLPRLLEIEAASYSDPWNELMLRSELGSEGDYRLSIGFAAEPEEVLVGHCFAHVLPFEVQVLNVAVHPEFQRMGIGRRLLSFVLEEGRKRGVEKALLEVRASNFGAQALYRSLGFEEVGRRKGYYQQPPEDALTMVLDFTNVEPDRFVQIDRLCQK